MLPMPTPSIFPSCQRSPSTLPTHTNDLLLSLPSTGSSTSLTLRLSSNRTRRTLRVLLLGRQRILHPPINNMHPPRPLWTHRYGIDVDSRFDHWRVRAHAVLELRPRLRGLRYPKCLALYETHWRRCTLGRRPGRFRRRARRDAGFRRGNLVGLVGLDLFPDSFE